MTNKFFPQKKNIFPKIYAYSENNPNFKGLLKIGYTTIEVKKRISQQYSTARPVKQPFKIELEESAIRNDGSDFTDYDIFKILRKKGFENPNGEWFKCSLEDLKSAINVCKENNINISDRYLNYKLRPEQKLAIKKTSSYFKKIKKENKKLIPHFLWNAKMRFGKTFTSYKLSQEMKWKKVLILTFKPAAQSAWEEDLLCHQDFEGWQFISKNGLTYNEINHRKPFVCFASFQDFLGKKKGGGIKVKNEWAHSINWDCIIFDEYHYGAWRENAKELLDSEDKNEFHQSFNEGLKDFDQEIIPLTTNFYLYLSGTPFRAISTGEFIEEQIFNWTYSDEQYAKLNSKNKSNQYESLPRLVMMTYEVPKIIANIAKEGEFDEFDLNEFFSVNQIGNEYKFKYENEVQKWLDLIRGSFSENLKLNLKLGGSKPPMPFSHFNLKENLLHTLWYMPNVGSCFAMKDILSKKQNLFYHHYKVVVVAGSKTGIGIKALKPVREAMSDPLKSKTITITCGKLTTGVTVKPWTGIFILRNLSSPESYFQAAFRVQSPWTITNSDGLSPNKEEIIKKECYIFDFSPNRALKLISDYSCRLNVSENNPEQKISEFIKFLPVLCYDGFNMKRIDPAGIMDIAMSGTSSTLLAKRWESALLVNVDNLTLQRLFNNPRALEALMQIEGFRSLNKDIETIINLSDSIKNTKKNNHDKDLDKTKLKKLTDEEKKEKSLRKTIQDKLIKFATRIPIFMYLTDHREKSLKDIITKLEPGLFKKVTGLTINDFELLISLGVFNGPLMNDAIYKFKRYEDPSLEYLGVRKNNDNKIGLFDTVINKKEFDENFVNTP